MVVGQVQKKLLKQEKTKDKNGWTRLIAVISFYWLPLSAGHMSVVDFVLGAPKEGSAKAFFHPSIKKGTPETAVPDVINRWNSTCKQGDENLWSLL